MSGFGATVATTIVRPSGDHAGEVAFTGRTETVPPFDGTSARLSPRTKAISLPSGDHAGSLSLPVVSCVSPAPVMLTSQMPPVATLLSPPANAMRLFAADQAGEYARKNGDGSMNKVSPAVPGASMTTSSLRGMSYREPAYVCAKTSCAPSEDQVTPVTAS